MTHSDQEVAMLWSMSAMNGAKTVYPGFYSAKLGPRQKELTQIDSNLRRTRSADQ